MPRSDCPRSARSWSPGASPPTRLCTPKRSIAVCKRDHSSCVTRGLLARCSVRNFSADILWWSHGDSVVPLHLGTERRARA